MKVDREIHPILTQLDLTDFVHDLTEIEQQYLINALHQRVVSKKQLKDVNERINEIGKMSDKIHSVLQDLRQQNTDVIGEVTDLKEKMKELEN